MTLKNGEQLLTIRDVCSIARISRTMVYSAMNEGRFPRPVRLGRKTIRWRASDIEKWLADLPASNERN
ncbi:MAG: AlpA family phage regulatory protein [Chloroflexi bacterium]|nr:AlpA family phage regulatory protein [Chloroflexota bacterium]